ncbi:hypothetical protein GALMADRAFT_242537 [Galerina marginata CBS 339.88]|uniref:F-box domain-containing protein n=1 Tax=Galerina marginata (strain CBS 339.88) TaxID=685588 RepID=A0A067TD05_GALM3|nr:hypothetical protein GALMADRAFT_242537 [Galerina marginata CBS 339.88]
MEDIPFSSLEATTVRQIYGHPPFEQHPRREILSVRGNYVAGSIASQLRKERLANKNYFHNLSIMLSLPLELVFEIFEHLHPIDLYNLIRSSKSFRNLLLNRRSSPLWSTVFERHPDVPRCPPGLSFPKWVSLLFGPPTCDNCAHPEAMVDFTFFERLCNACFDDYRYDEDSPVLDKYEKKTEILKLVRASYHDGGMLPPQLIYRLYYSKHEVNEMNNRIEHFQSAIKAGVPNATWLYQKFKADTAASVREAVMVAKTCNGWCLKVYDDIDRHYDELVQLWQTRLAALGYHSKDIERAKWDMGSSLRVLRVTKLTKKVFKRLLPDIRVILLEFKEKRLVQERAARRGKVIGFYEAYRKSTDPAEWKYFPEIEAIYRIGQISDYIYSELQDDIFPEQAAKESIRLYVNKRKEYARYHLSRIMHEQYPSTTLISFDNDPLSLAAAIFECPRKHIFIGWEDAWRHFNCIVPDNADFVVEEVHPVHSPTYSSAGYGAVKYLLGLLGPDPRTTLASNLETLKARFLCMIPNCPEYGYHFSRRAVLTLKECLIHMKHEHHTPQSFALLSDEATTSVSFFESQAPIAPAFRYSWSCRLCPAHFKRRLPRSDVVKHVRDSHSVGRPVENTDFFYCHWRDFHERKPFYLQLNASYQCNRCPETRKLRLWPLENLTSHLKDKHGVGRPVPGVHWIEISLMKDKDLPLPFKS